MTENEWTKSICYKLKEFLISRNLNADTFQKITYSQEIIEYTKEWEPQYYKPDKFETDLIIYETFSNMIKPRVIIEVKFGNVTTHDVITYSYKAEKHKIITPYIRYGITIGDFKNSALPGRLFRHGTNFDFMFCFSGTEPTDMEWNSFTEMILNEIEYSRVIEEMLHENRNSDRKHYYMLQKQLVMEEWTDLE